MEFERVKRHHSAINIAPLVDMIFLLLLFFMLTYQIVADHGIEVRLPEATSAEVQDSGMVEIMVDADENLYVNGLRVRLDDLPLTLERLFVSGDQPLIIRADRDSPVGLLVGIIDAGRLTGFSRISVMTEKK
jgi:biopolymer transport protein ExbD